MSDELFSLLQEIVRIPSVNPMGRDVQGDIYLETKINDWLDNWFNELGVEYRRQTLELGRDNVIAIVPGSVAPEDGGKVLMLEAHQDTVPIDGMTIDPFDPVMKDGLMYGRGSCDIKGGMACMLTAFKRLVTEQPDNVPTVVMACSVNEEYGMSGADIMPLLWQDTEQKWFAEPAGVIVAEPTMLDVVVAHKGVTRFLVDVTGKACHSSQPTLGQNAIYRMARIISVLEDYALNIVGTLNEHPLVSNPTLSVGMIGGGISINTVPDYCSIEVGRRVSPGESPAVAFDHIETHVRQVLSSEAWVDDITFHKPTISKSGLNDDTNGEFAKYLSGVVQSAGHSGQRIGVPYGTDGQAFYRAGVPTVVFGPGSIDQAHTKDEWIELQQLEAAAELYYQMILQFGA